MEIIPPYLRIYQQILKDLENAFPFLNVPKAKAGEGGIREVGMPVGTHAEVYDIFYNLPLRRSFRICW